MPRSTRRKGATCARVSIRARRLQAESELRFADAPHPGAALLRGEELVGASRHDLVERGDGIALFPQQPSEPLDVLPSASARGVAEDDTELRRRDIPSLVEHAQA